MKKNQKAFSSMIDVRQFLIGPPVQLLGYLVYLIFLPPVQTCISYKSSVRITINNVLSGFFTKIANSLLSLIKIFSFILITAGWLFYHKIGALFISIYCFLSGCILRLREIFNSSFPKQILRRNIVHFNYISIFVVFIVFISIFYGNVKYLNLLNNIYNDHRLICDTGYDSIDDVSNLSIYGAYQVPSNDFITIIVPTKSILIDSYYLTFKISTRAPPA
jgi:hypothetical protein